MITKLTISNFRSLGQDVELSLGPLTALVGINGSGKSNVCDALRFLSECLRDGLDAAVSRRNGSSSLIRWSSEAPLDLSLGVEVSSERGVGYWGFELVQESEGAFSVRSEWGGWSVRTPVRTDYSYEVEDGRWVIHPESIKPTLERTALLLPLIAGDSRFHELAAELRNIAIYQIFPNRLREPQKPNPTRPMLEHGENWASILKGMDAAGWKPDLLAALSRVVGDIDDISVSQLGGYLAVSFRHGEAGRKERWFDASQESDGTLRCAGILTALLQSPPLTLVGIEEPELTVHPGAIPVLYDFFRQTSRTGQVLLTTHSPDLLDLLDVEEVRVVERQEGVTRLAPLAEEQREAVKHSLLTPGELMRAEGLRPAES
ncbi:AAA family ATPase [Archangium sp.]|uniref:AAA family ATPase n=1 Tax=Archangium sp. TaxID=1872627 RepID=UPI002D3AD6D0|nr:AAA family ATPase [Archangium sp.]HYO57437.1 AAA family ATPase [Archangium sp.]